MDNSERREIPSPLHFPDCVVFGGSLLIFNRYLTGEQGRWWQIVEFTMYTDGGHKREIIARLSEEEARQVFDTCRWNGLDVSRFQAFWKPPLMAP